MSLTRASALITGAGAVVRKRFVASVFRAGVGVYHIIWPSGRGLRSAEHLFTVTPINAGGGGGGEVLVQDGVGPAAWANGGLTVNVATALAPEVMPGMTLRVYNVGGSGNQDRVINTIAGNRMSATFLVAYPFFEANAWDVYSAGAGAARVPVIANDGSAAPPGGANAAAGSTSLQVNIFDDSGAPADSDFILTAERS